MATRRRPPPMGVYSDHIVFRLEWEVWDDIDGYMMGCYDGDQSDETRELESAPGKSVNEVGCQTEPWEPPEAEPKPAPCRLVVVKPGTTPLSASLSARERGG